MSKEERLKLGFMSHIMMSMDLVIWQERNDVNFLQRKQIFSSLDIFFPFYFFLFYVDLFLER